jgi:hypothetical protein
MLSLELEKADVKNFMGRLLRENIFDAFEFRAAEIFATKKIAIDGTNENGEFDSWGEARTLIYEIIKLCAKPRQMKIIFSQKNSHEIHTNAAALFLNFVYENDGVTFVTATAQKEFALDKSLDTAWDDFVCGFFKQINVNVKSGLL